MSTIGRKTQQVVLLLACCALLLRLSASLRDLPSEHAVQRRLYALKASGISLRGLREAFEDDNDEDEELNTPKPGKGISRLGIHGEGLGHVSHNLMESDSEVVALAAALSLGGATAEGGWLDSSRSLRNDDNEFTGDDYDLDELASEEAAPEQEQVLQAAGLLEENDLSGEAGKQESAEEASAQARALEERDRNARPPWFSQQRTLTADPVRKDNHAPRQKSGRRQRHHSSVEDTWLTCHRQFVKELDEWDKEGGWDVLFYGDSIVEEWRGTFLGAPWGPFHDVRKVWDEFFGRKPYRAHSMGIASDGVEQVLWRIQHGELPSQGQHHPKVVIVHVGTNDIAGECTVETGQHVAAQMGRLLDEMRQRLPSTNIVVMAILPKGEVWPNRCSSAIDEANSRIGDLCEGADHLHFLDAGQAFLSETLEGNKFEIKETLMPDSMHPSAVGMRIIATRLEPLVSQLVASAGSLLTSSR